MVLPGQYLERPTLIARPVGEMRITLEGLFHRGDKAPAVVICAPHPRMGGSMDSPVVAELAWALTRAGHASLRFNYQGVGASEGAIASAPAALDDTLKPGLDALEAEIEDAACAVRHLADSVPHRRIAVAGYSFGAAVALGLALRDPTLTHAMLIAPPTSLLDFSALSEVKRPTLVAAGQFDPMVDKPFFANLAQSNAAVRWELVAGADHTFSRGLTELGRLVSNWLDATRESR
jgi:alpha/beta superfamily hydrolase